MNGRLVISICGACGAGKSQLAKTLVASLSDERSARVPTDYFIEPAMSSLSDYLRRPIQYDWDELERRLDAPIGTLVSTPAFDFDTFRRSLEARAITFFVRPVMIIDSIYPSPMADVKVLLETPAATRKARIAERDRIWGTRVSDRWVQLEASRAWLERLQVTYDLRLAGDQTLQENADLIVRLLVGMHDTRT